MQNLSSEAKAEAQANAPALGNNAASQTAANTAPAANAMPASVPLDADKLAFLLRKRDWLLDAMQRQRELAPGATEIDRRAGLSSEEFLERYYAAHRPVILMGEMTDWPALTRWTPNYLKSVIGSQVITYQGGRNKIARFEIVKDPREMPFDQYMDKIANSEGNDSYITANDNGPNQKAFAALHKDQGYLDKFLSRSGFMSRGMTWIGPAGTLTALHHDLTNNLVAQVVGRKRWKIVAASDVGKLYNDKHVYSELTDLEDPALDLARYPLLANARIYDVTMCPGEVLYVPFGWWHQVKALDFSVTVTFTNFRWPNQMSRTFPAD